ncbi:hypothetical protein ACF0H5_015996 [Mactra antiquata]
MKRDVCRNNKLDYECKICDNKFNRKGNLKRHVITHSVILELETCHKQFRRHDYLTKHQKLKHKENIRTNYSCKHCYKKFDTYPDLFQHVSTKHPLNSIQNGGGKPLTEKSLNSMNSSTPIQSTNNVNSEHGMSSPHREEQQTALQNNVQDRTIFPRNNEKYDMLTFFANTRDEITNFLMSRVRQHGLKWYLSVQVELIKEDPEGNITATSEPHFRSLTYATLNVETYSQHELNEAYHKVSKSLEAYLRDSSGWIINKVIKLTIHTVIYKPFGGYSYIPLPNSLKNPIVFLT